MLCPACHVDLRQSDQGECGFIVLDVCPTCKGAWFDKGELDRLDDSIWVNVEEHAYHDAEGDHKSATCPKCEVPLAPLSTTDAPDLIVDRCPSCDGFWLDNGELDRMIEIAEDQHNELLKDAVYVRRPPEWSLLKWTVYQFKRGYSG